MIDTEIEHNTVRFDDRYKSIIEFPIEDNYLEAIYWLNTHSKGNVKVEGKNDSYMYIGFDNIDDYLLFKVKFM